MDELVELGVSRAAVIERVRGKLREDDGRMIGLKLEKRTFINLVMLQRPLCHNAEVTIVTSHFSNNSADPLIVTNSPCRPWMTNLLRGLFVFPLRSEIFKAASRV